MKTSKEINSNNIDKEAPNYKSQVSLLLIACIIFDSPKTNVQVKDEEFCIFSLGAEANFDRLIQNWIAEHPYEGVVKSCYIHIRENDLLATKDKLNQIKNKAYSYIVDINISKVDIQILLPYHNFFTIYVSIIKYLLNTASDISPLVREYMENTIGIPIAWGDKRIKVIGFEPYKLEEIEGQSFTNCQIENRSMPTSTDARVAAILCEYTYYLSRTYEDKEIHGNKNDLIKKEVQIIEHQHKTKRKKKTWLGRDRSISNRRESTREEIQNLEIIPEKWKMIAEFNDIDNIQYQEKYTTQDNELINLMDELSNWDAIHPDMNGWIGMRDYGNDEFMKLEWEKSISKQITEKISNTRFALSENKGILNTWFGFCKYSGLGSVIFVNEKSRTVMYCTAGSDFSNPFKGEDFASNGDWMSTNFLQFFTGLSPQYQQSVTNAKILDKIVSEIPNCNLIFIGHSLGGGLASNNAIVTEKRHAITFNAAGLNWLRVPISLLKNNPKELLHPIKRRNRVHLFIIEGELLDTIQGTFTPLPWKLNELLYNAIPGQTKGYSSTATRKVIPSKLDVGMTGKHSLTNFMVPPEQILEIEI